MKFGNPHYLHLLEGQEVLLGYIQPAEVGIQSEEGIRSEAGTQPVVDMPPEVAAGNQEDMLDLSHCRVGAAVTSSR